MIKKKKKLTEMLPQTNDEYLTFFNEVEEVLNATEDGNSKLFLIKHC